MIIKIKYITERDIRERIYKKKMSNINLDRKEKNEELVWERGRSILGIFLLMQ